MPPRPAAALCPSPQRGGDGVGDAPAGLFRCCVGQTRTETLSADFKLGTKQLWRNINEKRNSRPHNSSFRCPVGFGGGAY